MEWGRFLDLLRAFERANLDYILVDDLEANLHEGVRATENVVLFLRPDPANIERLKLALRSLWVDPEIDQIRAADFAQFPAMSYSPPGEELALDIVTKLGIAYQFEDLEAEALDVGGVRVRVATPTTLERMSMDRSGD